ncbi:hypothetical protein HELRODRAFT_68230, partial [Helobdella robusta]|uniref:CUB domain-containing protein n=1 Tax=Helobdella robusta TaxID=6412 RepID=T1FZB9_HELRO
YSNSSSTDGQFSTPNYPGLYPRATECEFLFFGRSNERVEIDFLHFNKHYHFYNKYDQTLRLCGSESNLRLAISSLRSRTFQKLKSRTSLTSLISESNFLKVFFKSDDEYDATGFLATYKFVNSKPGKHTIFYIFYI